MAGLIKINKVVGTGIDVYKEGTIEVRYTLKSPPDGYLFLDIKTHLEISSTTPIGLRGDLSRLHTGMKPGQVVDGVISVEYYAKGALLDKVNHLWEVLLHAGDMSLHNYTYVEGAQPYRFGWWVNEYDNSSGKWIKCVEFNCEGEDLLFHNLWLDHGAQAKLELKVLKEGREIGYIWISTDTPPDIIRMPLEEKGYVELHSKISGKYKPVFWGCTDIMVGRRREATLTVKLTEDARRTSDSVSITTILQNPWEIVKLAKLIISTNPQGASVYINGEYKGVT